MKYVVAAACLLGMSAAIYADPQSKPADVVHYRQSIMGVIGWNFAPMNAMIKNKIAWDTAAFAMRADRLQFLSTQALEGFQNPANGGVETDAKPDIWNDFEDFKAKLDAFITEAKALSETAKLGDETKTREQFKKTAETCKACHDKYKSS
jgi:cytochrome c556